MFLAMAVSSCSQFTRRAWKNHNKSLFYHQLLVYQYNKLFVNKLQWLFARCGLLFLRELNVRNGQCIFHKQHDTKNDRSIIYTREQEYSKNPRIRTYRLKLGILIPKYIRTYLAWQRKMGSYTKKHSYFIAKILDFNC